MTRRMVFDDAGQPAGSTSTGPARLTSGAGCRCEFERLGLADRGRAAVSHGAAGRARAGRPRFDAGLSTAGEAGRVVRVLAGCDTLADAYRLADQAAAGAAVGKDAGAAGAPARRKDGG